MMQTKIKFDDTTCIGLTYMPNKSIPIIPHYVVNFSILPYERTGHLGFTLIR